MSNTHHEFVHLLRSLAGSVLVAGIVLIGSTGSQLYTGSVSGQGTTVIDHSIMHEATIDSPAMHSAAFILEHHPDVRAQLLIGMLLILLGFAFYSLWIVKTREVPAKHRRSR